MNAQQRAVFRRRFHSLFREACNQFDLKADSQTRHQVCRWILGYDKSSTQWTGKEYSLVVDQIDEWIKGDIQPHDLSQQQRNDRDFDQTQKSLIWKIENVARSAGLYDAYIQDVADKTLRSGKRPWREHGTFQLKHLRSTITARATAKLKKETTHD